MGVVILPSLELVILIMCNALNPNYKKKLPFYTPVDEDPDIEWELFITMEKKKQDSSVIV